MPTVGEPLETQREAGTHGSGRARGDSLQVFPERVHGRPLLDDERAVHEGWVFVAEEEIRPCRECLDLERLRPRPDEES